MNEVSMDKRLTLSIQCFEPDHRLIKVRSGYRKTIAPWVSVACFLPVLLTLALFAQEQHATDSLAVIESLIRAHQYDRALDLTNSRLNKNPNDCHLWTLQGIALTLKGDRSQALTAFDKALELNPGYMPALRSEVQIRFATGDKRAIPLLEAILRMDPQDRTANEMLAVLEKRNGDCDSANRQFLLAGDAIKTHSESLDAYGYCLVETKQFEKAVPVFEQLVSLLPDRTYPRYDLAVVLVSAGKNEAAIEALKPLLTEDQKDPDILSLASQAYEATKDTPNAVALLRQAIVLSPTTPDYYVGFASLCLDHDSFQTGVDMMSAGLQRIPEASALYISRGLLYVELAEFDKAEADFNRAEQLDSSQSLGSYALDLAEMQRNHPEEALAKVRSQLQRHPDDPMLSFVLAQLLMNASPDPESEGFKEAMRSAQFAMRIKPDLVAAHDLLGSIYMQAGQYDQVIEQCHAALAIAPSDETATYHLLLALKHTGHSEELPALSKRLAQLHRESLQQENERKRYRLVEQAGPTN